MMFTVKYCQRSGLQQLINALWMLGLALVVPQDNIRAEVTKIVDGRCEGWYDEATSID
jgi:hypothetical protein